MNKNIKYGLFFLGAVLILGGLFSFFSNNKVTDGSVNSIVIDTTNMVGDEIDISKVEDFAYDDLKKINVKINDLDKRPLLTFMYPNSAVSKNINDDDLRLSGPNFSIDVKNISNLDPKSNIDSLLSYHDSAKNKKRIFRSSSDVTIDGYKVEYARIQALGNTEENKTFYDEFQLYIKTDKDVTLFISFQTYDKKFTDKILNKFINEIKIEENKGEFLYSKKENNMLTYSFRIDYIDGIKTNTKHLNYYIPANSYQEVEYEYNSSHFNSFETNDKKTRITLSIENITLQVIEEFIFNNIKVTYKDTEKFESKRFDISDRTFNNIKFKTLFYDYNDTSEDKKEHYNALLYTEVANDRWYKIRIDSEVPLTDKLLEEVTNFKISEKEQ